MIAMRIRRAIGLGSLCVLGLIVGKVWYGNYRFNYVGQHFESVQVGDSREAVVAKLGKPNYHDGSCLEDLSLSKDCASELVYSQPLAPLIPQYYVVDLSEKGQVLAASALDSP